MDPRPVDRPVDPDPRIRGAFDLHVHAAPSLFPRWGDVLDLAEAVRRAEMRGFLLKSHHGSSVEAARLAAHAFPDLEIHGGIVLNHGVGGLNPVAVETAVALGARMIWLPTLHARAHGEVFGGLGGFDFQPSPSRIPVQGIDLRLDDGLAPTLLQVLEIARDAEIAVATGHASVEEILTLSDFLAAERWPVRILVNHVGFRIPDLRLEVLGKLADRGVWLELCAFTTTGLGGARPVAEIAHFLHELPGARWILASDSGQAANPPSPELLSSYLRRLRKAGVPEDLLRRGVRDRPVELLGL
jgi:hypothetical protein